MIDDLTDDEVGGLLKLEPHPTCGFVRVTFVSQEEIAPAGSLPHSRRGGLRARRSISW